MFLVYLSDRRKNTILVSSVNNNVNFFNIQHQLLILAQHQIIILAHIFKNESFDLKQKTPTFL